MFKGEKCLSTYQDLCKSFTIINRGKRGIPMFCAGSTLGRAQVPSYRDEKGQRHMLPREYPKCRRGESGYNSLRQPWLIQMFKDIESIALNFVYLHMPNGPQKEETIYFITKSKSNVPSELRISDTFFTQLSIIGRMSDNEIFQSINLHKDHDDVFSVVLHLGNPSSGGGTVVYDGKTARKKGNLVFTFEFKHGYIHFGPFCSMLHATEPWKGRRGSIVLNLKKSMVRFFLSKAVVYYHISKDLKDMCYKQSMIN